MTDSDDLTVMNGLEGANNSLRLAPRLYDTKILLNGISIMSKRLVIFILNQPVNFPYGRKLECPEKTHEFRQSVD